MAIDWVCTGSLLVLALWLLWRYWSWKHGHWQSLGVPCMEPSVPFGNVKDVLLGRRNLGQVIHEIYRQMEGEPFCGLYRLREPALLVRDADLVRTMLVKDFPAFHDNNINLDESVDPVAGRNPFVLKGDRWRKLRSQLSPSFTASRLKPMFVLMKEVCDELVETIKKEATASEPDGIEARKLCTRFTTDVVSTCAMGVSGGALRDPASTMMEMGSMVLEPSTLSALKFTLAFLCPSLCKLLRFRFLPAKVENFFRSVISENVAQRQQKGIQRDDYLQMLVELKEKGYLDSTGQVLAEKSFFTDVDIVAQVLTFITDGIATSASAMSLVLYDLALNPEVQERLRSDLTDCMSRHGGQLGYDVIQETAYLDMVVSESLRLHPPGAHLEKRCTAPYSLQTRAGRPVELHPGDVMLVSVMGLHKDPRYFPEPDIFDPERFSPDNKDRQSMKAYMPFGVGPRTCIGQRFALSQLKMGVAAVVTSFQVCTTPRTQVPMELDPSSILTMVKGGLWLTFKPVE